MNVHITSIEFIDKMTSEETTPLGEKYIRETIVNLIKTTWIPEGNEEQTHYFPSIAIADRIDFYSLPTMVEAIEAVIREVIFEWMPSLTPDDPNSKIDCRGGIDDRITITWGDKLQSEAATIAADNIDEIQTTLSQFLPPRKSGGSSVE